MIRARVCISLQQFNINRVRDMFSQACMSIAYQYFARPYAQAGAGVSTLILAIATLPVYDTE